MSPRGEIVFPRPLDQSEQPRLSRQERGEVGVKDPHIGLNSSAVTVATDSLGLPTPAATNKTSKRRDRVRPYDASASTSSCPGNDDEDSSDEE